MTISLLPKDTLKGGNDKCEICHGTVNIKVPCRRCLGSGKYIKGHTAITTIFSDGNKIINIDKSSPYGIFLRPYDNFFYDTIIIDRIITRKLKVTYDWYIKRFGKRK